MNVENAMAKYGPCDKKAVTERNEDLSSKKKYTVLQQKYATK
jgi:hypothetical protein